MVSEKATITFTADVATAKSSINTLKDSVGGVEKKTTSSTASMVKRWAKVAGGIYLVIKAAKLLVSAFKTTMNILKSVSQAYMTFEAAMAEVATISDQVTQNQAAYNAEVRAFAMDYAISGADAARGLYMTISAGITDAVRATEVLNRSLDFGMATVTGTREAVDLVTTVINAYGKETMTAARATDVLFTTVKLGKTTGPELAQSLGRVIPIAARAGVSIENLSAAMIGLTWSGLSTQEAATALRQMLVSIIKPSKGASEAAEKLGLELWNIASISREGGLLDALDELKVAAEEVDTTLVARLVPNVRALTGVMSLSGEGQTDRIRDALSELNTSMGASAEAAEKIKSTFAQTFKAIEASFQNLKGVVGEGFLKILGIDNVKGFEEGFKNFNAVAEQETNKYQESMNAMKEAHKRFWKEFDDSGSIMAAYSEALFAERVVGIVGATGKPIYVNQVSKKARELSAGYITALAEELKNGGSSSNAGKYLEEGMKGLSDQMGMNLVRHWNNDMTPNIRNMVEGFTRAFANIFQQYADTITAAITDYLNGLVVIFSEWGTTLGAAFKKAFLKVWDNFDFWGWLWGRMTGRHQWNDYIKGGGFGGQDAGDEQQFGGMVHGRGGRDAVPASLTSGEFVMRREAVDSIGPEVLEAINSIGPSTMNVNLPNVTSEATALQASPRLASGFSRFGGAGGVR